MAARELVSSASSVKILWNIALFVRTVIFSGDTRSKNDLAMSAKTLDRVSLAAGVGLKRQR